VNGNRSTGRRLKKSPQGRPYHRLHRRERTERAAAPLPHLGAQRTDAGPAVPLQLEDAFGYGRGHMVELLLPSFSWRHSFTAGNLVPRPSALPYTWKVVDPLGRTSGAPQRRGLGLHPATARADLDRVSARLRSGTEPSRISVVPLEAARTTQFLPGQLRSVESARSRGTTPDAPSPISCLRLLATGGAISVVTIFCKDQ
jgi:hypothetical protein